MPWSSQIAETQSQNMCFYIKGYQSSCINPEIAKKKNIENYYTCSYIYLILNENESKLIKYAFIVCVQNSWNILCCWFQNMI